jgi:hypothetical protein
MTCSLTRPERHIEFDLAGLPHATISEDYLNRLQKHLRFERILKYVALPRLTMESPVVRRKKTRLVRIGWCHGPKASVFAACLAKALWRVLITILIYAAGTRRRRAG